MVVVESKSKSRPLRYIDSFPLPSLQQQSPTDFAIPLSLSLSLFFWRSLRVQCFLAAVAIPNSKSESRDESGLQAKMYRGIPGSVSKTRRRLD